jgi:hypothetical protein
MPDFDFSSYPKPQNQQTNPLDMILKVGQVADTLGNLEAGKAVQGAIGPDGEIDRNAVAQALKGSVAGSMKAIPTLNAYEQLKNAGHVADQAGLENFQKRMALINHLFGGLASKDKPTMSDVNSIAARVLDPAVNGPKYGITFPVVMNALKNFRGPDGRPLPPEKIKEAALQMQTMTATTSEQLAVHSPRFQVVDDNNTIRFQPIGTAVNPQYPVIVKRIPTGTEITNPETRTRELLPPQEPAPAMRIDPNTGEVVPQGQSQPIVPMPRPAPVERPGNALGSVISGSRRTFDTPTAPEDAPSPVKSAVTGPATFAERYGPKIGGGPQVNLAPGVSEAAVSTAGQSAAMGNQLVTAANEAPATRAILDNLERTLEDFKPGVGADWARIGKSLVNTTLPESVAKKIGFDPKSIASQEEFNKLAYNLAQSQFQALGGTGTDAKLNSTMSTSPIH